MHICVNPPYHQSTIPNKSHYFDLIKMNQYSKYFNNKKELLSYLFFFLNNFRFFSHSIRVFFVDFVPTPLSITKIVMLKGVGTKSSAELSTNVASQHSDLSPSGLALSVFSTAYATYTMPASPQTHVATFALIVMKTFVTVPQTSSTLIFLTPSDI